MPQQLQQVPVQQQAQPTRASEQQQSQQPPQP
jgi:hypothetical protein